MSILGVGTDLVNIKRVEAIIKKNKNLFLKKILHPKELIDKKITPKILAKKFAAKEAFSKSIGTGIGDVISFNEIFIDNNKLGAPIIKLDKNVKKKIMKYLKVRNISFYLSISDDYPFALATVIISK